MRPRRVEGGLKARSRRGAIGEKWWSARFIEVLESIGVSGRLSRGRDVVDLLRPAVHALTDQR